MSERPYTFTTTPNAFYDFWMYVLTPNTNLIFMFILRSTHGWQKEEISFSIKDIVRLTGKTKNTIKVALKELLFHMLISQSKPETSGRGYKSVYRITETASQVPLPETCDIVNRDAPTMQKIKTLQQTYKAWKKAQQVSREIIIDPKKEHAPDEDVLPEEDPVNNITKGSKHTPHTKGLKVDPDNQKGSENHENQNDLDPFAEKNYPLFTNMLTPSENTNVDTNVDNTENKKGLKSAKEIPKEILKEREKEKSNQGININTTEKGLKTTPFEKGVKLLPLLTISQKSQTNTGYNDLSDAKKAILESYVAFEYTRSQGYRQFHNHDEKTLKQIVDMLVYFHDKLPDHILEDNTGRWLYQMLEDTEFRTRYTRIYRRALKAETKGPDKIIVETEQMLEENREHRVICEYESFVADCVRAFEDGINTNENWQIRETYTRFTSVIRQSVIRKHFGETATEDSLNPIQQIGLTNGYTMELHTRLGEILGITFEYYTSICNQGALYNVINEFREMGQITSVFPVSLTSDKQKEPVKEIVMRSEPLTYEAYYNVCIYRFIEGIRDNQHEFTRTFFITKQEKAKKRAMHELFGFTIPYASLRDEDKRKLTKLCLIKFHAYIADYLSIDEVMYACKLREGYDTNYYGSLHEALSDEYYRLGRGLDMASMVDIYDEDDATIPDPDHTITMTRQELLQDLEQAC